MLNALLSATWRTVCVCVCVCMYVMHWRGMPIMFQKIFLKWVLFVAQWLWIREERRDQRHDWCAWGASLICVGDWSYSHTRVLSFTSTYMWCSLSYSLEECKALCAMLMLLVHFAVFSYKQHKTLCGMLAVLVRYVSFTHHTCTIHSFSKSTSGRCLFFPFHKFRVPLSKPGSGAAATPFFLDKTCVPAPKSTSALFSRLTRIAFVLQVRPHETINIYDGQPICLMEFFRNSYVSDGTCVYTYVCIYVCVFRLTAHPHYRVFLAIHVWVLVSITWVLVSMHVYLRRRQADHLPHLFEMLMNVNGIFASRICHNVHNVSIKTQVAVCVYINCKYVSDTCIAAPRATLRLCWQQLSGPKGS